MNPPKPNFLILGAQKCGTGWLHRHLSAHPEVFMPAVKELEFFSYERHLEEPGFSAYLEHFAEARGAKAIGEASPSYFWTTTTGGRNSRPAGFQRNIPAAVLDHLGPELKLVVALRDPVERALSAYAHYVAHGRFPPHMPFAEAMSQGGILDMGFYAQHLENWHRCYSPAQFLVLSLEEDIQQAPERTLHALQSFLGVSQVGLPPGEADAPVFPGTRRVYRPDGSVGFEAPPHHAGQVVPFPSVSAGEISRLRALYREDVEHLDRLTGADFANAWGLRN